MTEVTRDRILDAACTLYLEKGLQGLSLREVARQVGISATAIYRHFMNKEDLVIHVVDKGFRIFGSYLQRALEEKTPEERLNKSGWSYVEFALDHPGYYNLIFVAPQVWETPALPEHVRQRSAATFQMLVDRVQECLDSGWQLRVAADSVEVARGIWALTHGLVSLYLAGKLGEDEKQFRLIFANTHRTLRMGLRQ